MKNLVFKIVLLLFITLFYNCKQPSIQEQLDKEFGAYTETPSAENKLLFKTYNKALTLWEVPYGQISIKTSLGNAHVLVSGPKNAPPIVLLHGMNATSTMWYPNIKALTKNYRVYAIDHLLEPGKSICTSNTNNMESIIDWYHEVFAGLKLKEFSLVGASKGGWLATTIALKKIVKVNKLILLSPAQTLTIIPPSTDILTNVWFTINPKKKNLPKVLETMSVNPKNINKAYTELFFIATEKAAINKTMLKMTPFSDKELQALYMPVLILIGDDDIINSERGLNKAKELIPYSDTEIIPNAGHFLSIDQPLAVNKKMTQFLNN